MLSRSASASIRAICGRNANSRQPTASIKNISGTTVRCPRDLFNGTLISTCPVLSYTHVRAEHHSFSAHCPRMMLTRAVTSLTFTAPSLFTSAIWFCAVLPRIMLTSIVTSLTFTAPSLFTSPFAKADFSEK